MHHKGYSLVALNLFFIRNDLPKFYSSALSSMNCKNCLSNDFSNESASSCLSFLTDPCQGYNCPPGEYCFSHLPYHGASCRCPDDCSPDKLLGIGETQPVCGSNGQTFSNECQLFLSSCKLKTNIYIKHIGSCGGKNTASLVYTVFPTKIPSPFPTSNKIPRFFVDWWAIPVSRQRIPWSHPSYWNLLLSRWAAREQSTRS